MAVTVVEEKNEMIIVRHFYPVGRGVITRQTNPVSNVRKSVFFSSFCCRTSCAYDTIARKTCKDCRHNLDNQF